MQNVDCFPEFGDVHHSVDATGVLDPNLFGAGTHSVERLPVGRFEPGLDLAQLEARFPARTFRKCQQIVVGRTYRPDLFLVGRRIVMYKVLYAITAEVKPPGYPPVAPRRRLQLDPLAQRRQREAMPLALAGQALADARSGGEYRDNDAHQDEPYGICYKRSVC